MHSLKNAFILHSCYKRHMSELRTWTLFKKMSTIWHWQHSERDHITLRVRYERHSTAIWAQWARCDYERTHAHNALRSTLRSHWECIKSASMRHMSELRTWTLFKKMSTIWHWHHSERDHITLRVRYERHRSAIVVLQYECSKRDMNALTIITHSGAHRERSGSE